MSQWLNTMGKVAIVTGGSSGIGAAIVKSLLDEDVKVANFDLSKGKEKHENLLFLPVDVSNREQVESAVNKVVETFGTVDCLVNNAGINIPRLLVDAKESHSDYELSDAIFDKMVAVNQKGSYLMSQAVGRILVAKQSIITKKGAEDQLKSLETLYYQRLGFLFILFPLYSCRWFTCNIIHDTVNVIDFIYDTNGDFL